jgi:hypothetical protein
MQSEREKAAAAANAEDASTWRWLSLLLEERRIKWRYSFDNWTITVDRKQLATACTFDSAIRLAKSVADEMRSRRARADADQQGDGGSETKSAAHDESR